MTKTNQAIGEQNKEFSSDFAILYIVFISCNIKIYQPLVFPIAGQKSHPWIPFPSASRSTSIPDFTDGAAVSTVSKGAFEGSSCLKLTLGVNISRLDGGALSGSQITEIIIPDGRSAEDISVPNNTSEELFVAGGQQRLAIYVDSELYEEYIGDYFWGDYAPWLQSKAKK